jgi:hypothetical protein
MARESARDDGNLDPGYRCAGPRFAAMGAG